MRPAGLLRIWAGIVLSLSPAGVAGQDALTLELLGAEGAVQVRLGDLLSAGPIRGPLDSGLPVRIRLVTELWRDRLLDTQEARHEWRATVRYDPLAESYRVDGGEGVIGHAGSTEGATELLRESIEVPLRPNRPGRYYYLARLELETLSPSDLEELRRWLQGDLAPTLEDEGELGGVLVRGLRRLFVRALGLPAQRHQARSARFLWGG